MDAVNNSDPSSRNHLAGNPAQSPQQADPFSTSLHLHPTKKSQDEESKTDRPSSASNRTEMTRQVRLVLGLLGELGLDGLLPLLELALGLEAHDASAPLPLEALVELRQEVGLEGAELALVLLVDLGEADHRGVLLVHQGAEASLHESQQQSIIGDGGGPH